ncbi:MAG: Hsp20/alpha crystallin family protein [Balneolaceae bacterium]
MTLIKYNRPDTDFFGSKFSDVLDEFFNEAVSNRKHSFVPRIDVSETEKQYEIDVQLPGMKREDIKVQLEDGRLNISGERKLENETEGKTFHKVESSYGSFTRVFQLPDNIDQDSVKATYENGILTVSIGKSKDKVQKQISIK